MTCETCQSEVETLQNGKWCGSCHAMIEKIASVDIDLRARVKQLEDDSVLVGKTLVLITQMLDGSGITAKWAASETMRLVKEKSV